MFRVGLGYDIHPFGGDGPLVLGGVIIDGPGLAGHSDADVVAHAVADSVLGPTGLPDLGMLFPATDERWRGVSSIEMLRDVVGRDRRRRAGGSATSTSSSPPNDPSSRPTSREMAATLTEVLRAAQEPLGTGVLRVGEAQARRGHRHDRPRRGHRLLGRQPARTGVTGPGPGAPTQVPSTPWSASATPSCATRWSSSRASRARCRCTSAARPSTTCRTSATAVPRSAFDVIRRYLAWRGYDGHVREQRHRRRGQDHRPRRRARHHRTRARGRVRGRVLRAARPPRRGARRPHAARHRVHRRDARPGGRARAPTVTPTWSTGRACTSTCRASRATARCRTAAWPSCSSRPARASTSTRPSAARWTSRCGRRPSRASPPGTRRGGRAGRAGTSSARRCRSTCSARASTSTAAATTSRSRTTRTSAPRPRPPGTRSPATGSTAAWCWWAARRCRSRSATSPRSPTRSTPTGRVRSASRCCSRTTASRWTSGPPSSKPRARAWSASTRCCAPPPPPGSRRSTAHRSTTTFVAPFRDAMDDDFNTPLAMGVVFEAVREANRAVTAGDTGRAASLVATVRELTGALGLDLDAETRRSR